MSFQVIVTLGPSILQRATLREIDALGPCIYRINGAHVAPTEVTRVAAQVRDILGAEARVMIDLPGNKVRTANLSTPLRLVAGSLVELADWQVNLRTFHEYVQPGDTIYANDSTYRLTVERIEGSTIVLRSHSDGLLQTNKGLHLPGITERLPFLFDRDRALMDAACACDLTYVSLSFVRTAADVREARAVLAARTATPPALIAKIETAPSLAHLDAILAEVDTINVDRGDLSADIGMLQLPGAQRRVVETGRRRGRAVFLATQFLKHMESSPVPLIAEVTDLYKTIDAGVAGIQLSEETAVGGHAVACVSLAFAMARQVAHEQRMREAPALELAA